MKNTFFILEPKSWWKDDINWVLKSSCFWYFQKWKVRSFFEPKSSWKDDIYWLLKSSCFELFVDGKYGLFFSEKVDGKMIFTWYFWAFHGIPGLGKYGFSCSVMTAVDRKTSFSKFDLYNNWSKSRIIAISVKITCLSSLEKVS